MLLQTEAKSKLINSVIFFHRTSDFQKISDWFRI